MLDRRKWIGGSDIAAVVGLDPYRTPVDLWLQKTGRSTAEPDAEKLKFFRRRKAMEPIIVKLLREEHGIEPTKVSLDEEPNRYVDEEHDYFAAEIDFETLMTEDLAQRFPMLAGVPIGATINGEIKTVSPFVAKNWGEQGTDECPIHVVTQALWGLGIRKRPACLVCPLFGLDDVVIYPIIRDEEAITEMRTRAMRFWSVNVLGDVPPEPVNIDDVGALYSRVNGRRCELSQEAKDALEQLLELRAMLNDGEKRKDELAFIIANHVRKAWGLPAELTEQQVDDAVLLWHGKPMATWKKQRGTSLDQKRLKADKPEITEAYTREHWYRVARRPAKGIA